MSEIKADNFRQLYGLHSETILKYAVRRVDQSSDAADIVSETFLIAWEKFDQVPHGPDSLYWLYAVARRVLSTSRRKGERQLRIGSALKSVLAAQPIRGDHSVEVLALKQAMAGLADEDRELIGLSAWEGLNSNEIGKIMDLPPNTVRTRLARARQKLKDQLAGGQ